MTDTNTTAIADEIEALRYVPYHELVARFSELWGYSPPIKSRAYAIRRTAWKLQANATGGLSDAATKRLDELIDNLELPLNGATRTKRATFPRRPGDPKIGTVLVRLYKGQEIHVLVRPDGYEWNGGVYRSLSALAREITGSRWNGRLFFGVGTKEKRA